MFMCFHFCVQSDLQMLLCNFKPIREYKLSSIKNCKCQFWQTDIYKTWQLSASKNVLSSLLSHLWSRRTLQTTWVYFGQPASSWFICMQPVLIVCKPTSYICICAKMRSCSVSASQTTVAHLSWPWMCIVR